MLIRAPEFKEKIDRGEMIDDRLVCERLFTELCKPMYSSGVLVDGFPRTSTQVEVMKMFQDRLHQLRRERNDESIVVPKYKIVVRGMLPCISVWRLGGTHEADSNTALCCPSGRFCMLSLIHI